MKNLFLTFVLILVTKLCFTQQNNATQMDSIKTYVIYNFKTIPPFKYNYKGTFFLQKGPYLHYYNTPLSQIRLNRHQIAYLTTNSAASRYYKYGNVDLNPWNAGDGKEGLFLGATNFILDKFGMLK